MAQIDHLVDAASEEIGGAAHRKTPRKPQQNSRKLGEMLAENDPKVVSDQCVMESQGRRHRSESGTEQWCSFRFSRQIKSKRQGIICSIFCSRRAPGNGFDYLGRDTQTIPMIFLGRSRCRINEGRVGSFRKLAGIDTDLVTAQ
jgi:hypothetical protein